MTKVTVKASRKKGTVSRAKIRKAVKETFSQEKAKVRKTVPVRKSAYITPQKFLKLPLSAAILQVIEDVRVLHRKGIRFDMSTWWYRGRSNKAPCSVCLGGAALCSFNLPAVNGWNLQMYGEEILGITETETMRIAQTFNNIRLGDLNQAFRCWYPRKRSVSRIAGIRDWAHSFYLSGSADSRAIERLASYLKELSEKLAATGY